VDGDPAKPGAPPHPEQAGPHLIVDEYGKRRWAWWVPGGAGVGGNWMLTGNTGNPHRDWRYIGPAKTPDGLPVN
jgi:hypothetical protein